MITVLYNILLLSLYSIEYLSYILTTTKERQSHNILSTIVRVATLRPKGLNENRTGHTNILLLYARNTERSIIHLRGNYSFASFLCFRMNKNTAKKCEIFLRVKNTHTPFEMPTELSIWHIITSNQRFPRFFKIQSILSFEKKNCLNVPASPADDVTNIQFGQYSYIYYCSTYYCRFHYGSVFTYLNIIIITCRQPADEIYPRLELKIY